MKNNQKNPYFEALGSAQTPDMFFNPRAICLNHLSNYYIFSNNLDVVEE